MQCISYCTGEAYDLALISEHFTTLQWAHKIYGKEVLHLESIESEDAELKRQGDIFIFSYGCVIFWGKDAAVESKVLDKISAFLKTPRKKPIEDRCTYVVASKGEPYINEEKDTIIVKNDDPNIKLSFSYGLSQSIKLSVFEESVEKTIDDNKAIPSELIKTGGISLSRKDLAKKIGTLFAERNYINLNSDILDTPDFFWRRAKYEPYYEMSVAFMDIKPRLEILNTRLDIIHELYGILSTELQHIHSSRLELIIIFLILIEVILGVSMHIVRDLLHWI